MRICAVCSHPREVTSIDAPGLQLWPGGNVCDVKHALLALLLAAGVLFPGAVQGSSLAEHRTLVVSGQPVSVTVVRFSLSRYRIGVSLAGPHVADNAFLLDIAARARALCAINGTFLAAYTGETGEPYGTLVIQGKVLHLGAVGTRLDVFPSGRVRLTREGLQVRGALDGSYGYPANWYAYNINQTPSPGGTGAYLFTPERGRSLGFRAEMAIVVRQGHVVGLARGQDVSIPPDGFILVLQGREVDVQGWKFGVGRRIEYQVVYNGASLDALYSLGAGPRLVEAGRVSVNPSAEGFQEAKILSLRKARSAVGFTDAGEVLLVAMDRATVTEAAKVMRTLGAGEAMNLDGGASSGLVCDGAYLVRPGRAVANALVLWPKER